MGSTGRSAGNNNSMGFGPSPFASREEMEAIRRQLNYQLPPGAESITLLGVSNIDENGYADVEYEVNYRTPYTEYDADGTPFTTYENESEVQTERRKIR